MPHGVRALAVGGLTALGLVGSTSAQQVAPTGVGGAGAGAPIQPAAEPEQVEPTQGGETTPEDAAGKQGEPDPKDPQPPTTVDEQLRTMLPGAFFKRELDKLAEKTNLRLGFANTILFQQASGGPGWRNAASGDLDLLAKWTAIGAGTKDTGVMSFAAEYRYQIGSHVPADLGKEIGTLTPTTNSFSERPMIVKEWYWDQRLFEDHFRFVLGRVDPENLFGGHRLQSSSLYFLNKVFSGNTSVAYAGPGLVAAAQLKPVDWLYVDGGITDANGTATTNNVKGFFEEHEYLSFVEAGLTPKWEGVGLGRYRVAFWHIDERDKAGKPSDEGITVSCDQDLGEKWTVFARYGYSDADVTAIRHSVQGGFGVKSVFLQDDMLGVAAAWSRPKDTSKRDEKVVEVFERFQVTPTGQLTVGAQAIFDPSNAPGDDVIGVFEVRLRIAF